MTGGYLRNEEYWILFFSLPSNPETKMAERKHSRIQHGGSRVRREALSQWMLPLKVPSPLCGPLPPVQMLPLYPTPGSLWCISMTARGGGEVDPPSVIKEVLGLQYSSSPLQPTAVLVHSSAHTRTRTDCLSLVSWLVVGCPSSSSPQFSISQHLTHAWLVVEPP